ncbi:hypothetical protein VIGAN_10016700 [Vigna angularis var. angularis]|uniref:Uncharacterized protein n=1 Tax=Vigna angularis var. angularis TaxID=157739 RepID=A0A0S3T0X1_PHAAN|nr:hypothetical protein VIGAN_10016700 [Vigna angularis var. angularis]
MDGLGMPLVPDGRPGRTTLEDCLVYVGSKNAWDAIHRNKSSSKAPSPDKQEGKKKLASESNRFTYSGELLPGRLSPFRRSRAAATGISPS